MWFVWWADWKLQANGGVVDGDKGGKYLDQGIVHEGKGVEYI